MGSYRALFELTVDHSYFANGKCSCLDYIPNDSTARMIKNAGLLIKKTNSGLLVLYDLNKLEALRLYLDDDEDGFEFIFKLFAKDPDFKAYTEPFSEAGSEVLYFDSQSSSVSTDGKIRLHASKQITRKYLSRLDSVDLKDVLSQKERLLPPVSVIKLRALDFSKLFNEQSESRTLNYYLKFKARHTYWKYYLHSKKADKSIYINDPENRVSFLPADTVELSDGRTVLSYRSKKLIPLNEHYNYRFQLKQPKNGGEQVLFKQLPFPRLGQFGKEVIANRSRVVSEIYINC
ncbi:MAG: hypothetical protein ABFS39_11725 [Pseudomonadota bacterium]